MKKAEREQAAKYILKNQEEAQLYYYEEHEGYTDDSDWYFYDETCAALETLDLPMGLFYTYWRRIPDDTLMYMSRFELSNQDARAVQKAAESAWLCTIDEITEKEVKELLAAIKAMED